MPFTKSRWRRVMFSSKELILITSADSFSTDVVSAEKNKRFLSGNSFEVEWKKSYEIANQKYLRQEKWIGLNLNQNRFLLDSKVTAFIQNCYYQYYHYYQHCYIFIVYSQATRCEEFKNESSVFIEEKRYYLRIFCEFRSIFPSPVRMMKYNSDD